MTHRFFDALAAVWDNFSDHPSVPLMTGIRFCFTVLEGGFMKVLTYCLDSAFRAGEEAVRYVVA
jgi:hypothetical protein